jgi:kynurenine formamidase
MPRRYVDLSVPIQNPSPQEKDNQVIEVLSPRITYQDHTESLPDVTRILGCSKEDLPDGLGWANEAVHLSTHAGTHMDAPYHYFPTVAGQPARTIEELPLEWFFGAGVVLDLRHKQAGEKVTVEDVSHALERISYQIKEGDIVCLWFGMDKNLGTLEYWTSFPGMSAEATRWLVDRGVRIIGTDAMGFDIPFENIKKNFERDGDASKLWEAHRVGMDVEYCQIEKMANLDKLPPHSFQIVAIPIPVAKASAGWCRPVAIIDEP